MVREPVEWSDPRLEFGGAMILNALMAFGDDRSNLPGLLVPPYG